MSLTALVLSIILLAGAMPIQDAFASNGEGPKQKHIDKHEEKHGDKHKEKHGDKHKDKKKDKKEAKKKIIKKIKEKIIPLIKEKLEKHKGKIIQKIKEVNIIIPPAQYTKKVLHLNKWSTVNFIVLFNSNHNRLFYRNSSSANNYRGYYI